MQTVTGKRIWIVGASEGIGEALARRLAAMGARLALSARSKDKITALVNALPGSGHLALPLDVTQIDTVRAVWVELLTQWGGIDTVIYNAGAYEPMGAMKFDLGKSEHMLDINFRGALRVLDCVLPDFIARRSGHIVLVASVAAYSGLPNAIGYGASKAALLHLAENLRLDLARCDIKVQVVSPGFVKTRLTDKNTFKMPFIVSPQLAAERITQGMASDRFEIHFPRRFTLMLKCLSLLPYRLYFSIVKHMA
jgi:short-subunit dehydrogenase